MLTAAVLPLAFLLMIKNADAQNDRRISKWFEEARQHFSVESYNIAIDFCERIIEDDPDYTDAILLLTDIYHEMNIPQKEII